MKKVAAQKLQLAAHAKVRVLVEMEIVEHIEVKVQKELGFAASVGEFAIGERTSDREKMIGDALHGGDDHGDVRSVRGGAHEARSVEHAIGTKKRAAAELESDNVAGLLVLPACAKCDFLVSGRR